MTLLSYRAVGLWSLSGGKRMRGSVEVKEALRVSTGWG